MSLSAVKKLWEKVFFKKEDFCYQPLPTGSDGGRFDVQRALRLKSITESLEVFSAIPFKKNR